MSRRRVLVAGLYHETNTFLPLTPLADFTELIGSAFLASEGDGSPLGCALEEARRFGWEVIPGIDLRATPSGMVEDRVVERFGEAMAQSVSESPDCDGILCILHGAMVAQSFPDVEGEILERIRRLHPGFADIPLVAVLDLHATITDQMAAHVDAFAVYRENPHTDAGETGRRAARLLYCMMRSGERMQTLCARPPVIWPPTGTASARNPLCALEALARNAEANDPALAEVGVIAGFSFADVPEAGVGFTIAFPRDDDEARRRAETVLQKLCRETWEHRAEGNIVGIPLAEAMAKAKQHADAGAPGGPLIMAEPADNIGAGAPGDRTGLLKALLETGIPRAATTINDPDAAALASGLAPGESRSITLGGKTGGIGGEPLTVMASLLCCSDGRFTLEDRSSHLASMGGEKVEMGPCALLRCTGLDGTGDVTVLVTSRKTPPFDLGQWRSVGIDPARDFSVIAVKAAVAHRRAYDPIAGSHLTVETPGPCASDLTTLPYNRLRRLIYPLDARLPGTKC